MNPWQIQLQNGNLPAAPLQRAGKMHVPCRHYCGTIAQGGSASLHCTVAGGGLLPAKLDEKARKAVENDIEAIHAEAKDADPSWPVVEGKLKSVESTVTRAIGIGSTLGPVV
jgi:hypothetical protein